MAVVFKQTDKPELIFNGKVITDYFDNVRTYDFDLLPENIRSEVLAEDEPVEPDCS